MILLCARCRRRTKPERDCFGERLPRCDCREPVPVGVGFNPVRGKMVVVRPGHQRLEAAA